MENYYLDIFNFALNILLCIGIVVVIYIKNKNHKMISNNYIDTIKALESAFSGEQIVSKDWRELYFDLKKKSKFKMPICISFCIDSVLLKNHHITAMATLLVKRGFDVILVDDGDASEKDIDDLLIKMHLTRENVITTSKDDTYFISDHNIHIHFCGDLECVTAINRDYPASKPAVLVAQ